MKTKTHKNALRTLTVVALMMMGIGIAPNGFADQGGESGECEETIEQILDDLPVVEPEQLDAAMVACNMVETAIAVMGWGSTEPGLFPDVVALTPDGCNIEDLAGKIIDSSHNIECEVFMTSLVWEPGQFEAHCIMYDFGLWAGTLTTFGRTHHCKDVQFFPVVGCAGITVAEVVLYGETNTHTSVGNGVGTARC